MDDDAVAKVLADPLAAVLLASALERFEVVEWNVEALHDMVSEAGEALGWKLRQAQAPIRLAVTGSLVGPPLFESLVLLGRARVRARLERALNERLGGH